MQMWGQVGFYSLYLSILFVVDGALTLEEIVAEVSAVEEDASDSEAMEEEELEEHVVTRQEAQAAFNLARRFVEKNTADHAILSHSDALDEFFYQERKK